MSQAMSHEPHSLAYIGPQRASTLHSPLFAQGIQEDSAIRRMNEEGIYGDGFTCTITSTLTVSKKAPQNIRQLFYVMKNFSNCKHTLIKMSRQQSRDLDREETTVTRSMNQGLKMMRSITMRPKRNYDKSKDAAKCR